MSDEALHPVATIKGKRVRLKVSLLKRIVLKLPVLRKTQPCEACGQSFACEISLGKGCWCAELNLSENTRQELRANYRNCLCHACLEKFEAKDSESEAQSE
jgi:hypothetical protein